MRKWWLWFVMLVGMFWGGGQRVEAALPYQNLLFENVTWSPGMQSGGMYMLPKDLWTVVNQDVKLRTPWTLDHGRSFLGSPKLIISRINTSSSGQIQPAPELSISLFGDLLIKPRTVGEQFYRIKTINLENEESFEMDFTLHVVSSVGTDPKAFRVNTNGYEIFDFVPLELFLVDVNEHKYVLPLSKWHTAADPNMLSLVLTPNLQPLSSNEELTVYRPPAVTDLQRIQAGSYRVIHHPNPIAVNQRGEATVKLPVIVPPYGDGQVRFAWVSASGKRTVLPITEDGTVHFSSLTRASFPMKWQIEYKISPFKSDDDKASQVYDYDNILGTFLDPLTSDIPVVPLPPLFTGTYTLAQIAAGSIAVAPEWHQLDITANGPWTLQISLKAPPALPMRLRLGEQETGTEEAAIALSGVDNQTVSLAESRLIIPKTPLLSPGTYTAEITFSLIRGPTS